MLANSLFYAGLLAAIAMTFLSAGLAMTRMSAARLAQFYLPAGYQRAAATLQQTLAAQIQSGGLPDPLPTFTPLPPACVDASSACAYRTSATIEFTQAARPSSVTACDPSSQGSCAGNEQANPYVNESRLPARIAVTVTTAAGVTVAQRTSDIVLRTIDTAPYVILAGARDGSFDGSASSGDDGGALPATPNPCAPASASGSSGDDTVIRVAYRNAATGACSDGSVWRSSSYAIRGSNAAGWSP